MITELKTIGEGTKYPVKGILTIPDDTKGPVPAVVMVHGSGSTNHDEKVGKLTPFRDLAFGLEKHGIASLRYDKRSYVHGRKMIKDNVQITAENEVIEDVIMAVKILKEDPRIDSDSIFILGHSMGAMLAPRIDAEGADARGLIMMAGSPYRLEEILVRQLKQAGGKGRLVYRAVARIEDALFSKKFDGLYEMSDEEAKQKKFAGGTNLYYFKEMGLKTAADYLAESTKPVIIMQGGKDFQCLADIDYKRFKELFEDREDTYFKLYPELNHAFVSALFTNISDGAKEFAVERHIEDDVIGDIAEFIHKYAKER